MGCVPKEAVREISSCIELINNTHTETDAGSSVSVKVDVSIPITATVRGEAIIYNNGRRAQALLRGHSLVTFLPSLSSMLILVLPPVIWVALPLKREIVKDSSFSTLVSSIMVTSKHRTSPTVSPEGNVRVPKLIVLKSWLPAQCLHACQFRVPLRVHCFIENRCLVHGCDLCDGGEYNKV